MIPVAFYINTFKINIFFIANDILFWFNSLKPNGVTVLCAVIFVCKPIGVSSVTCLSKYWPSNHGNQNVWTELTKTMKTTIDLD